MCMDKNDAPASWFATFRQTAVEAGWIQSTLDACLFTLRCPVSNRTDWKASWEYMLTTPLWVVVVQGLRKLLLP